MAVYHISFSKEFKKELRQKRRQEFWTNVLDKIEENSDVIKAASGVALITLPPMIKIGKKIGNAAEMRRNSMRFYDRSHQTYVQLKRPLRNDDVRNLSSLQKQGYKQYEALRLLGLLK